MLKTRQIILYAMIVLLGGCVVPYYPEINDKDEMIIVQGLITDQPGPYTVRLSKSTPLWSRESLTNLGGCLVWITDNEGHSDTLRESLATGVYLTDPVKFRGEIGRTYQLHIKTNKSFGRLTYESEPMTMIPVPPVDRIYYVKEKFPKGSQTVEGCRIFFDTYDPNKQCSFYRWNYTETWEFRLPFIVPYRVCWISNESREIFIKNTDIFTENRITGFPILTISDPIDRLSVRYSLLLNQYSLNVSEFIYWERIRALSDQTGGLYDMIPSQVPNNIYCLENPDEKTLGFFSVSAVRSKRIFIEDTFEAFDITYLNCIDDKVVVSDINEIPGLNTSVWIISEQPPLRFLTYQMKCADCRSRGTSVKPQWWDEDN